MATALDKPQEHQQTGDQHAQTKTNGVLAQFLNAEVYQRPDSVLKNVEASWMLGKNTAMSGAKDTTQTAQSTSSNDAGKVAMLGDFRIDGATKPSDTSGDLRTQRDFDINRIDGGYAANANARNFTASDNSNDRKVA